MEGVLNIDKPIGLTSHDVVGRVRRLSGTRRVGHTGTLDPLATGILVVCLGRATRLVEYVVGRPKTYTATIRLGQTTNTYDTEGEITAEQTLPDDLPLAEIRPYLAQFRGEIAQIPPLYSAIKKDGQPLYKLARQGKTVELEPRQVTIYELEVLAWQQPDLSLQIRCSAGTYIRSIAHDLGQLLGYGGHLTQLRRTAVGAFNLSTAVALDELTPDNLNNHLVAADLAVQHLPAHTLTADEVTLLFNGTPIPPPTSLDTEMVRVYTPTNAFAGLVSIQDNHWRAKKMFIPPIELGEDYNS